MNCNQINISKIFPKPVNPQFKVLIICENELEINSIRTHLRQKGILTSETKERKSPFPVWRWKRVEQKLRQKWQRLR